jgi:hypothetical protein
LSGQRKFNAGHHFVISLALLFLDRYLPVWATARFAHSALAAHGL